MKWIKCSEKLPEVKIDKSKDLNQSLPCICLLVNKEVYKMYLSHWFEDKDDSFFWYYSDNQELCEKVTHWMYYEEPE